MKKSACLFIALSFVFVTIAEAKTVKKAKKEEQTILLRVRLNGKELKVVNVPLKAKGIKLTINPTDVVKALKADLVKKAVPGKAPGLKTVAPAKKATPAPVSATAPSLTEEIAPSVSEDKDDGIAEIPEVPSESRKETRSDLAPAPAVPIPTETPAKYESHFYEKWWFWTAVGVITAATVWKVGDHNHWWDIHISSGRRR